MVKRPVKLNAARYPRAEHSYKRRLYNMLFIEKVVSRGFIKSRIYPSAYFGKYLYFKIFVFKHHYCVLFVDFFLTVNFKHYLIRVRSAARALMHSVFCKHRHFFRRSLRVSRNYKLFNFTFYTVHII